MVLQTAVDVAIVGGGPAGLAAAHSVLQARPGTRVAVLERSDVRPRGATFGIAPNGVRALEAISPALKAALQPFHVETTVTRRFNKAGELTFTSEGNTASARIREHGELLYMPWHVLQRELAAALPEGVLHTHHRFLRYTEGPEGVVAEFETPEGTRQVAAQLLLGCDGGQSAVREAMLADGPPTYLGLAIWRAARPKPDSWSESYASFGGVGQNLITTDLGDGKMVWQGFAPWPKERLEEIGGGRKAYVSEEREARTAGSAASRAEGVQAAREARLERALEAFDGFPPHVLELISTTDPSTVTEHGQFCREAAACQVYAKGRVALTGDAAHLATPFLGQGCSQALEDALELGRAVGKHGPTPAALQAYQAVRVPMAGDVQAASVELCRAYTSGNMGPGQPSEYDVNISRGFVQRVHEPLTPAPAPPAAN